MFNILKQPKNINVNIVRTLLLLVGTICILNGCYYHGHDRDVNEQTYFDPQLDERKVRTPEEYEILRNLDDNRRGNEWNINGLDLLFGTWNELYEPGSSETRNSYDKWMEDWQKNLREDSSR